MRKGFTLVELLIVIVVIGVLSAMMMLSANESVKSAKAAKIISDMTILKKAVNAWYLENFERIGSGAGGVKNERGIMVNGKITRFSDFINGSGAAEFLKYIDNGKSIKIGSKSKNNTSDLYILRSVETSNVWYISYYMGKADSSMKSKLAAKAKSIGLYGCANLTDDKMLTQYYTNQNYVNLMALSLY